MYQGRGRAAVAGGGLALAATLLSGSVAFAGGPARAIEVDTTADDPALSACTPAAEDCSLRGAVDAANAGPGSTITFASSVTGSITVGAALSVTTPTSIEGPGADVLQIDGGGQNRIFDIPASGSAPVAISGLRLWDAYSTGEGGAVRVRGTAPVTLSGLEIAGNYGYEGGGAISGNAASDVRIEGSTISSNRTANGYSYPGGGILAEGRLVLENSTVVDNTASGDGGGVSVRASSPSVRITNSTIAANYAYGQGGGLSAEAPATLAATIVAGNGAYAGSGDVSAASPFTAVASLIEQPGTQTFGPGSTDNTFNQSPLLGGLDDEGGPTRTMKPAPGSPVVDAGGDFTTEATRRDQRGAPIYDFTSVDNGPSGPRDIGAFELRPAPAVTSLSKTTGAAGDAVTITGSALASATAVMFGTEAAQFTVVDETEITATVPAGSGTVDVQVVSGDGTSQTGPDATFRYAVAPADETGTTTTPTKAPPAAPAPAAPAPTAPQQPVVTSKDLKAAIAVGLDRQTKRLGNLSVEGLAAKPSMVTAFSFLKPGTLAVRWVAPRTESRDAVLIARGEKASTVLGQVGVRMKLTERGRRLLRRSASLRLRLDSTFRATGGTEGTTSKSTTLKARGRK